MIEIIIKGNICSKKNLLRFNANTKRPYYDKETRANIDGITNQIIDQWGLRPPLYSPSIAFVFYVQSGNSDRDNKTTTILDCLVAAGVLKDDSIDECNGEILIGKAYRGAEGTAGARVFIEPSGNLLALYRKVSSLEDLEDYRVVKANPKPPKRGFRQ